MPHPNKKRQTWKTHHFQEEEQDEEFVDDLAIAATYAAAETPPQPTSPALECENEDDSNEIDLGSESEVEEKEIEEEDRPQKSPATANIESKLDNEHVEAQDNDDDDESEVDLAEQLENMISQDVTAEEGDDGGGAEASELTAAAAKTTHEIDAYQTQIAQLEPILGTSLTIPEMHQWQLMSRKAQLVLAGKVQHYLAEERIVVVQSEAGLFLEEGNLLVLKSSASLIGGEEKDNQDEEQCLVPMGKVLEVFGPVSQPMYSIRLPEATPPNEEQLHETQDDNKIGGSNSKEQTTDHGSNDSTNPWSPKGKYTQLVQQSPGQPVYYVREDAMFIDTNHVYKQSGRGCDASNVHDEEDLNPNEVYYSDDEKEQQAKSRRRRKKHGTPSHESSHGGGATHKGSHGGQEAHQPRRHHTHARPYPPQQHSHTFQYSHPSGVPQNGAVGAVPPQGFYNQSPGAPVCPQPQQSYYHSQQHFTPQLPPTSQPAPHYPQSPALTHPPPPPPPPTQNPMEEWGKISTEETDTIYYD